jgi:hypothetical protein
MHVSSTIEVFVIPQAEACMTQKGPDCIQQTTIQKDYPHHDIITHSISGTQSPSIGIGDSMD